MKALIRQPRVSKEIPLYPLAKTLILNASSILVFSGDNGLPTPAAWERIRLYWSSSNLSLSIIVVAKLPNPVVIPYTTKILQIKEI